MSTFIVILAIYSGGIELARSEVPMSLEQCEARAAQALPQLNSRVKYLSIRCIRELEWPPARIMAK